MKVGGREVQRGIGMEKPPQVDRGHEAVRHVTAVAVIWLMSKRDRGRSRGSWLVPRAHQSSPVYKSVPLVRPSPRPSRPKRFKYNLVGVHMYLFIYGFSNLMGKQKEAELAVEQHRND